ncbi:MAG: DUF362 domain-containing protein [Deltaproteobacteria bacterium]|nr:DUF362 domain-containing protein [Deltaproteobacteria bacterium]
MTRRRISRRAFLSTTASAAKATLGATLLPRLLRPRSARAAENPLVYSAFHENMVTGAAPDTVQAAWVKAGVDACVKAMTGQSEVGRAWEAIFPGITAAKKIAIKVNCLNTSVYPQLATVSALVEGMRSMLGGTYPAANICLFDNNLWTTGKVDACYGAAQLDALGIVHGEDSYDPGTTVSVGGTTMYVSRSWAQADYGVCLAKMAPHQYYAGGLSGVIKNMMGAVSISSGTAFEAKQNNSGFHDGAPYTAFRDLWLNYADQHLHLYLVDMLFAARHENESGWSRVVKRITMGTDPAAVDSYNVDKINELGMSVVQPVTKAVPLALEAAGVGTTSYTLVEPAVSLAPAAATRSQIDARLRARRQGTATDAEVRQLIKSYREQ